MRNKRKASIPAASTKQIERATSRGLFCLLEAVRTRSRVPGSTSSAQRCEGRRPTAFENTAKNRETSPIARTDAIYAVSMEMRDDLAGNTKDVCVKGAKAGKIKGPADTNVDRVTSDTRRDAATKQADARSEEVEDTTTAEFNVAVEKCGALAGQAKDDCVSNANMRFGQ